MSILQFKNNAQDINDLTFTDNFYRLSLIAKVIFEYKNLPNHIDEKWIEKFLFAEGKCMAYNDPEKGLTISKCAPFGLINHYDEPTELQPYGTDLDFQALKNGTEAVLIRNNDEMLPTSYTIQLFAYRLTEISRTIDININAQKTPVLILCSEKQRLTLKNVYKQWNGFEPVIFGDKNLDIDGIKVLKTDAPIIFDKLQIQKHAVWNECMTFLGINNANMDKRERLVDDEVQANNEQVSLSAQIMLKSRKQAVKQINELFGTNISVNFRDKEFLRIMAEKEFKNIDTRTE